MTKTEELKGVIKEVFSEEIKASEKRAEEREQAWQKTFEEQSAKDRDAIVKRIEAIESTPVVKSRLSIPGKPGKSKDIYLGFRLDKQLSDIFTGQRCAGARDLLANPKLFPMMADEAKREEYAKHLIMIVRAAKGDHQANKDYQEWVQKADMAEGTGSYGGYLVPEEYSDEILAFQRLRSFALQDCRIWPMSSDTRRVPVENTSVSTSWKSEGTAAGASNPTFAEAELAAKKLTAYSTASNELLQDSMIDIVSYLTELFAEASGQELDNQVLNGTGDPVSGLLTAACGYSVVMASGLTNFSSVTGDNLLDLIDKIPMEAEDGAKFYMHKKTLTFVRKLKDSQNQYLFAPIAGGLPADIWGYPYVRTNKGPTTSAASTAFILFGNLRYFLLGRRLGTMTLDLDPFGKFLENQTRFRLVQRWALKVGKSTAFARLVTAAS